MPFLFKATIIKYFGLNSSTFYKWLKNFRYELMPPAYKSVEKFLPKPEDKKDKMTEKQFQGRSSRHTAILVWEGEPLILFTGPWTVMSSCQSFRVSGVLINEPGSREGGTECFGQIEGSLLSRE